MVSSLSLCSCFLLSFLVSTSPRLIPSDASLDAVAIRCNLYVCFASSHTQLGLGWLAASPFVSHIQYTDCGIPEILARRVSSAMCAHCDFICCLFTQRPNITQHFTLNTVVQQTVYFHWFRMQLQRTIRQQLDIISLHIYLLIYFMDVYRQVCLTNQLTIQQYKG